MRLRLYKGLLPYDWLAGFDLLSVYKPGLLLFILRTGVDWELSRFLSSGGRISSLPWCNVYL